MVDNDMRALWTLTKDACASVFSQAVGLCMHLRGVRLIDCPAFHGDIPCDFRPAQLHTQARKGCGVGSPQARLSAYPIALHKLKAVKIHDEFWRVVRAEEADARGPELERWRRSSG